MIIMRVYLIAKTKVNIFDSWSKTKTMESFYQILVVNETHLL